MPQRNHLPCTAYYITNDGHDKCMFQQDADVRLVVSFLFGLKKKIANEVSSDQYPSEAVVPQIKAQLEAGRED